MGPIISTFVDRVIYDSTLARHARVADIVQGSQWSWPISNSTELLALKDAIPKNMVPCSNRKDQISWTPSPSGVHTTKSTWEVIRRTRPKVPWWKIVWFSQAIPRSIFFLWLATKQSGELTQDSPSSSCVFCGTQVETHNHLFFEYCFTWKIWSEVLAKCHTQWLEMSWDSAILYLADNWRDKSLLTITKKLCLNVTVSSIWKKSNDRYHSTS